MAVKSEGVEPFSVDGYRIEERAGIPVLVMKRGCAPASAAEVAFWRALSERDRCLCNVGVQECPVHPGRLRTKDEKIAFRKQWDARVDEGR